jgi:hypothetical protein
LDFDALVHEANRIREMVGAHGTSFPKRLAERTVRLAVREIMSSTGLQRDAAKESLKATGLGVVGVSATTRLRLRAILDAAEEGGVFLVPHGPVESWDREISGARFSEAAVVKYFSNPASFSSMTKWLEQAAIRAQRNPPPHPLLSLFGPG